MKSERDLEFKKHIIMSYFAKLCAVITTCFCFFNLSLTIYGGDDT